MSSIRSWACSVDSTRTLKLMKNTCMSSDYLPWFFPDSLPRTHSIINYSCMKDRCGFLFVRYKRHCCTELVSWEHAACPLSGIKKRPLVGGWFNTSSIVISIGAAVSLHHREVVRSWEGPLWEVPLYTITRCGFYCGSCYDNGLLGGGLRKYQSFKECLHHSGKVFYWEKPNNNTIVWKEQNCL